MREERAHHLDVAATDSSLGSLGGVVSAGDLVVRPGGSRLEASARRPGLLRRPGATWLLAAVAVDSAMLALATALSQLKAQAAGVPVAPAPWLALFPLLVLGLFWARGMYARRLRLQVLDDLRAVVALTAVAGMAVISLRALLDDDPFVAAQTVRHWLFAAVYLGAGRAALTWWQRSTWAAGDRLRPTLIVGAGQVGRLVARRLLTHPESGLLPIGFLDRDPLAGDDDVTARVPVLGASWDLEHVVDRHGVEHVIVTFSTAPHHVLLGIIERCTELGLTVSLVPRLFEKVTERVRLEHLGGLPLVTVERVHPKGWQFALKHAFDRVAALAILLLTWPLLLAGAVAVAVSMGRPVLYRQARVGRDGRTFVIRKFRSMRPAGDSSGGGPPTAADDAARLTRVGSFLRRASIDELPQLFNVLRGEMSIVGPRPERPEFAEVFEEAIHRYDERHRVKSGITGWAQVHGIGRGSDRFSADALADRVEWDNYYIENWSLWLDTKILLMTIAAVLRFRQA